MCISSFEQTQIVAIKWPKGMGMVSSKEKKGGQEQNIRQNLNEGKIYGGPIKHGTVNMIA